ncbi:MAG: UvrD-helicase domain-containing protein [Patescibacteria group bacterium]|nr:UvrD-helicase domain-containing protein [Patescibacteria group bacterium]MDD5164390.1 UvrD-helicase domain-containing protein [Patescibacteria group bacterium]MDD5534958.1 UvrD-helicase domain-containing protein [Patescibacteria group bacterium]
MPENEIISKIIEELNPRQKEAVTHVNGPLIIIAGAGTGKTRAITYRIAWLILSGQAKPEEILAVTFTDKATQEMEERVDKLLPYGYVDIWISTFHSFCERVLRDYAIEIGLPIDFKLLDTAGQCFLVQKNFDRFDLDYYRPLGNPTKFIRELVKHFGRAKDEVISPKEYLEYAQGLEMDNDRSMSDNLVKGEAGRIKEVANAYYTYQQLLLDNGALDFGDLINYTIELFSKRPEILEKYRKKFKYILVDEFQDTNWAQYKLLQMLAQPENLSDRQAGNITVVTDDKQAIYRWRGAAYNNVFQLKKDFPKCKIVFLDENYRSRQAILDLAYKFIEQNYLEDKDSGVKFKGLLSKNLKSTRKGEAEIAHIHAKTQEEEAKETVKKIIELRKLNPKASWNDFAILVRANNQAEIFCQTLRWNNIPYQFLARTGLFSKPIVMDILAYLKLLDNYHESPAVYRILTSPIFFDELPNQDLINLTYWANRKNWSIYEAIAKVSTVPNISPKGIEELNKVLVWIEKHTQLAKKENASKVIYAFLEDTGYLKLLSESAEKGNEQNIENIFWLRQFFNKVKNFEEVNLDKSISNFIQMIDLMLDAGDTGAVATEAEESGPETVKVMTIHAAKGLEFNWVFVVNLVDRRFPTTERHEAIEIPPALIKEIIPEGDIHFQEERRLFYVAMTRAKDGLFLTSAENYGGKTVKKFSRFLHELGLIDKKFPPEPIPSVKDLRQFLAPKEIMVSSKSDYQLPTKFSFTQLMAFETCPLQYKFAHILKIPRKGKGSLVFGQSIHNTLQKFLQKYLELKDVKQAELFVTSGKKKSKKEITFKDLIQIYNECWIDEWYEDKNNQDEYKERGKKILKLFYDNFMKNPPKIKSLELPFNFKLGEYALKGKIDRIDEVEGGIEIIDYKTGNLKEKLNANEKWQLLIYQLALRSLFREPAVRLTYYYLETGDKISFLGDEKELEEIEEKIKKIIKEIKQSEFPPKATKCQWCDFKDICEYKAV